MRARITKPGVHAQHGFLAGAPSPARERRRTRRGSALLCGLLALCLACGADARTVERSKQKAAAEAQRAGIQQKLTALQREITRTESEKEDAADTLRESEKAISDADRALHELADEQEQTNGKLADLAAEQERLAQTIAAQKKQLSTLLREHYVAGNEDRIKLLLSGDNPNRINRDLQLMAYVSQAQARLLDSLKANLAAVEANRQKAQDARDDLEDIAQEQREQKSLLEKEKARRAQLLASLSTRLASQHKEVDRLKRDEQRLGGLVDRLTRLIRQQAIAAEAERRRREALAAKQKAAAEARAQALAKAKAERERLAREKGKHGKPEPLPEEPKLAQQPQPEPATEEPAADPADIALAPAAPDGAFAALRGRMAAPVAGTVAARFGAKRGDGPSWKGVFIKAPEGAAVRAVAGGRVVFANWMRGFGNLIIVDHGSEYLSIYGNNQALLKHAGDVVKAGDVIANAGSTGGNEESGLYFELRHLGKAFDPAGWVRF